MSIATMYRLVYDSNGVEVDAGRWFQTREKAEEYASSICNYPSIRAIWIIHPNSERERVW